MQPRDRWMAWDAAQREQYRNRIVNVSRFLIRPSVRCTNLASYALELVLRRLATDYSVRYGYAPYVAETFVDPTMKGLVSRR